MFCGPTLSLLDISNNLTTFAWIPLVLWCALSGASAPWSGAAIAMSFLAGEPFFATAGAVMFVLIRRRQVIDVALTAFCLAAIELLPYLAATVGSDRAGAVSAEEILRDSMPLGDWLYMAIPPPIGSAGIAAGLHERFIPLVYVGLVPVVLAVVGVVTSIRRRATLSWLALLAVCILISSGSFFRPVAMLLTSLPVTLVRYPARVVPLGALAVIALAVVGWDRLAHFAGPRWLALLFACLIIIDLTPRVAPLLKSAPFDPDVVPYSRAIGRDAKIVRRLMDIYARASGERPPPAISGGGTYAKRLPDAIAFGMWFPGKPYPGHDVDEQIAEADLQRGLDVLIETLHDLAGGPPMQDPFRP